MGYVCLLTWLDRNLPMDIESRSSVYAIRKKATHLLMASFVSYGIGLGDRTVNVFEHCQCVVVVERWVHNHS